MSSQLSPFLYQLKYLNKFHPTSNSINNKTEEKPNNKNYHNCEINYTNLELIDIMNKKE